MITYSREEFEERESGKGTGCYYLSHGALKVMYTLRYSSIMEGTECFPTTFIDRHERTLAQDYNKAIDILKEMDDMVYVPKGFEEELNPRGEGERRLTNIFQSGKWKGETVEYVYKVDKEYLIWYVENIFNKFTRKFIIPLVQKDIDAKKKAYEDYLKELEETKKLSNYQGEIGEKLERKVTLDYRTGFETQWGWTNVFAFIDENYNKYIWMTSSCQEIQKGETFIIKGTVKDHNEYNNEKQTKLIRVKII